MGRFIVRRLVRALITLLVFQTLLFTLIQAVPWDYANMVRAPAAQKSALRHNLGLDLPVGQQYLRWMENFFTGNLGYSFERRGVTVSSLFLTRLPRTLLLFFPGMLVGFGLGLWLGKHVAWRRGGWVELGTTVGGTIFYTSFAPWLAFVLVYIFALQFNWMPPENIISARVWAGSDMAIESVAGWMLVTFFAVLIAICSVWQATRRVGPRQPFRALAVAFVIGAALLGWSVSGWGRYALDMLYHLLLPLVTLVLLSFGETMLLMRTTMLDVLLDDHVAVARAKGLTDAAVRDRHVARLAILPVLARFIVQLPLVIIGSFALERIFFWGGMGEVLFRAVDLYDVPVIMGVLSIVGVTMLMAHLALDILTAWLDPRLRDLARIAI